MHKLCKRCNVEQPVGLFSPRKDARDGLAYWCNHCKTQATKTGPNRKAIVAAYAERNKDACKQRVRAAVAKKPEHYRAAKAAWVAANHERVLEKRRENYAKDPAKDILRVRVRQKRIRSVPAWLTPAHTAEIAGLYFFCKVFKGFEVDHVIPLNGKQVSGLHVPENLQVLTVRANRQKGANYKE